MGLRKLQALRRGQYVKRGICSTGAEAAVGAEALFAADAAAGIGALEFGTPAFASTVSAAAAPSFTNFLAENALSLGLQGAGGLVKMQAQADAAARRKRLSDAMSAYQSDNARKAMDLTEQHLQGSTPEAREAALERAEAEGRLGFEKTVGAAQAFEQADSGPSGKLSAQYKAADARSADAAASRTKALIENLATMRAPGAARTAETRRFARAAGGVDALQGANASVGRAYQSDMGNVAESPWATLGGEVLSGVGQGLMLQKNLKKPRAGGVTL